MRSGNPTLKAETFDFSAAAAQGVGTMTLKGTVQKTFILLLLALVPAMVVWGQFFAGNQGLVYLLMIGGAIGSFIVALITVFKKTAAPITAPIHAVLEGLFLGGISAVFEAMYPNIVIQAAALTFGVAFNLLFAYRSGLIRATENFKLGVTAATGGIMLLYAVGLVMRLFGGGIPFIHESGMIGIGFSLFVVVIAALNLVLDFDFIEKGVENGAPRYMEWYGAFGLIVTLVWLYVEFLRLLAKLRDN